MSMLGEMSWLQIAFLMFSAGAAGGVLFAALRGMGVRYPALFGAAHGLLGLAAVALLAWRLTQGLEPVPDRAWWALAVLAGALAGGVTFFRLLKLQRIPMVLPLAHGAAALLGLYLLFPVAFPAAH